MALCDSSAQGIGASRPDRGYVGLVAERVRARTGKDVQVINLSVSGARIDDLLEDQLPLLANLEADLVTVTIGGNDVHTHHAGTFAAQVDRLTAALPPGTFIADVPYFMHGHWERDAQQSADVLTRSASKCGLSVVPLHDALRRQGWSAMLTQFAADLFHPNDRGYRVWADAFWDSISHSPTLGVEVTDGGRLRLDAADDDRTRDRSIDRWQDDGGRVLSSISDNSTFAASAVARSRERDKRLAGGVMNTAMELGPRSAWPL